MDQPTSTTAWQDKKINESLYFDKIKRKLIADNNLNFNVALTQYIFLAHGQVTQSKQDISEQYPYATSFKFFGFIGMK